MPSEAAALSLAEVEALLAAHPLEPRAHYLRAGLLAQQGRFEEAKQGYLQVIALDPAHFGALNDLGSLLYRTDYRTAAKTAYAEAVRLHPDNPIGRINLGNALLAEGAHDEARAHYEAALRAAPDHPDALQGMANLLQELGETDAAEAWRQRSYAGRGLTLLPYRGTGEPCRVLLLASAAGGNLPTRFILDDRVFAVQVLAAEAQDRIAALPAHDLVFNAIGDADLAAAGLAAAEAVLARTTAPVLNPPSQVASTGRAQVAARLEGLPGVVVPRIVQTGRDQTLLAARIFGYPLLVRSLGFHTGRHFVRAADEAELAAALPNLPGRTLLLIEPLDARDAEGWFRKYRVMMIGGRLFPLHLALSRDWKVHYFSAEMAQNPQHRALEAAFLEDMEAALGARAIEGLAAIAHTLGLDYAGADFSVSAAGEVLLFEANAAMSVHPPNADPRWDYRRPAVERVLKAVQALALERAGRGG